MLKEELYVVVSHMEDTTVVIKEVEGDTTVEIKEVEEDTTVEIKEVEEDIVETKEVDKMAVTMMKTVFLSSYVLMMALSALMGQD